MNFRQLRDSELDHLLVGGGGALSGGDLLDDLGEHVAHKNGNDSGRRFVGTEPMLVAGGGDAGAEQARVLMDPLEHGGEEGEEANVLVGRLSRLEKI